MDSKKILYFLDLLNNETKGRHSDVIAEMYQRALDENDDIIKLKSFLQDYTYSHELGKSLYQEGVALLDKIYAVPSNALEILPQLKQVQESIENEAKVCKEYLHSPLPFRDEITVLKKIDRSVYRTVMEKTASACVYLIAMYAGIDPLRNLTWEDSAELQEMIHAVNAKFLPALCSVRKPDYFWVITKKRSEGRNVLGGDVFYLSYQNIRNIDTFCGTFHKESIGTHAFWNIDAYETGKNDVPFCWGIGNIVSVSPANAILFLQKDVVIKLRSPKDSDLTRKMPPPLECIRHLSDGGMFCLSPDELVLTMNQWQAGHEIEERKQMRKCLFCGKNISGKRMVCSSHFTTEL